MKLHLPKLLRNSVLACITAVAGIATTTVGTATFTGGVVAFALSSQQAAADYVWNGGSGNKTGDDWKNESSWNMVDGSTWNPSNLDSINGPGTTGSNMWDKVVIDGGDEGVVFGSEDSRDIPLEGWAPKYELNNNAKLYANMVKLQPDNNNAIFTVRNNSLLDFQMAGGSFQGTSILTVGENSGIIFRMQQTQSTAAMNITMESSTGYVKFLADSNINHTGAITLNPVLGELNSDWGSMDLGITAKNVTLSNLTVNPGAAFDGWTKVDTQITEANYAGFGNCYSIIKNAEGKYMLTYAVLQEGSSCIWNGGELSWANDTAFSNKTFSAGSVVEFSDSDADVVLQENIEATAVIIDDGVTVSLDGNTHELNITGALRLDGTLVLKSDCLTVGATEAGDNAELVLDAGAEKQWQLADLPQTGTNACTAKVTVASGSLYLTSGSQTMGDITVEDGAGLRLGGPARVGKIVLNGDGGWTSDGAVVNAALLRNNGQGDFTINAVDLASDSTVQIDAGMIIIGGELSGNVLTKNGTGTLRLDGAVNNSGLVINGGTVRWGGNSSDSGTNALTCGSIVINTGATFQINHSATNCNNTTIELNGGILYSEDSSTDAGTGFKALKVGASSQIKYHWNGGLSFGALTGEGDIAIVGRDDNGGTSFGSVKDYHGTITSELNRPLTIGAVDQAAGKEMTIATAVTLKDFAKTGEGSLVVTGAATLQGNLAVNYEGTLTLSGEVSVADGTVLSYTGVNEKVMALGALNTNVLIDILAVDAAVLASGVNLGITLATDADMEAFKSKLNVVGLEEYAITSKDGQAWLSSSSAVTTAWDKNWGVKVLAGSPASVTEIEIAADATEVYLKDTAANIDGTVAASLSVGHAGAFVFGGAHDTASTGSTWITAKEGNYKLIVGGNYANNWGSGTRADFNGDSHIVVDGATVGTIVGGNYKDGQGVVFNGSTYISVFSGDVTAGIVGAGTNSHYNSSTLNGNTNIFVYVPLAVINQNNLPGGSPGDAIIGGGTRIDNAAGTSTVNGNTNITIDLSNYTGEVTNFAKSLLGGHFNWSSSMTANINGNTNVTVKGKEGITFGANIVGGSHINAGSINTTGISTVALGGGSTYSGKIVGASYLNGNITSNAGGTVVSLGTGAYNGTVIGGSYHNDSGASTTGDISVSIGGTVNQNVVGGSYVNTGGAIVHTGDIAVQLTTGGKSTWNLIGGTYVNGTGTATLDASTGDISVTLAGGETKDIFGGSYVLRNKADATLTQENVTVDLKSGTLAGDVYAAGYQGGTSKIQSASTTVILSADVATSLHADDADGAQTISGGYKYADGKSGATVQGDRTLVLVGNQDRSGISFADFDKITVKDTAKAAIGALTTTGAVTKNGAGTLTLAGGTYALSGGLTVAEGMLGAQGEAVLGGALTLNDGTGLDLTSGTLALNGDLTLGTGLVLTTGELIDGDNTLLTGITSSAITETVAANTIFSSINGLHGFQDYTLRVEDGKLVLTTFETKNVVWDEANSVWASGAKFGSAEEDVFMNKYTATFGPLTGSSEEVTINGPLTAQAIHVTAGVGKEYSFVAGTNGTVSTEVLAIGAGTAKFAGNTLQLGGLVQVSIAEGGTLDLTGYGSNNMRNTFNTLLGKVSGDGTLKLAGSTTIGNEAEIRLADTGDVTTGNNYAFTDSIAIHGGGIANSRTLTIDDSFDVEGEIRAESFATIKVTEGGTLTASSISLGHSTVGNDGFLVIEGGSVVTGTIANTTGNNAGNTANRFTMTGGKLQLTTDGANISGIQNIAISGGELVADGANWGVTGGSVGGVKVTGTNTITLTGVTLTSTIDNSAGKLALGGAIDITSAGYVTTETPSEYSVGTNEGYVRVNTNYVVANTAADTNLSIADGTTWTVDGSATNVNYDNGVVTVAGTDWGTDFYVRSDKALSDIAKTNAQDEALETIVLAGGGLNMNEALGENVTIRIEKEGQTVVNIGGGQTLAAGQVTGTDASHVLKLHGNGTYALADGTATLGNAVLGDWAGTVKVTNVAAGNMTSLLNGLGNANSTVEVTKLSGWFNTGTTGAPETNPCEANLKLNNAADGTVAITINNLNSDSVTSTQRYAVLSGDISGSGDIKFISHSNNANVNNQVNYKFTGDVSGWDGAFINAGAHDRIVHVIFAGSATTINADVVNDGNVANCKSKLTIGDDVAASYTMNGEVDVNNLIVNQSTAFNASVTADEVTVNAGTSSMTGGLDVTTLTNNGTLTVSGTLAEGASVTNGGTLNLGGDYTLASLNNTGSVVATGKSIIMTGATTGAGSITAGALTLQAASNTVGDLTLTGALTLGTADVASTLNAGVLNIGGDVVVNKLTAGLITSTTGLATDSKLNLSITEDVLLDYMLTNATNTLELGQIAGVTLDKLSLNGNGSSIETVDGQYTYTLSVDGGSITLNRTINGQEWEGTAADNQWGSAGNWSADTTPGADDSVKFTGNGSSRVTIAGLVEIGNVTIDIEEETETYEYMFLAPADGSSVGSLAITKNLSVNAGTLTIGVSTTVAGRTEVLAGSTLNVDSGDLSSWLGFTNGGTLNISAPAGDTQSAVIVANGDMVNTGTIMNGGVLGLGYGVQNAPDSPSLHNSGTVFNAGFLVADGNLNNTGILYHAGMMRALGNLSNTGENAEMSIFGGLTEITGTLDNDALLEVNDGMVSAGSVDNSGTMNVSGGELTIGAEGAGSEVTSLENSGALAVTGGSVVINGSMTNDGADTPADMSISGEGTSVNITGALTNADSVVVSDGASLSADSAANTGSIEVTGSTLVLGDATTAAGATTLDNDGSLTVSGSEATTIYGSVDNDGSLTVVGSTVNITGDLDNTNGTITIGSDTATGTLEVGGDLTGTGGTDKLVVNSGSTLDVHGDLTALDNVELDFDGTVIVGGDVKIDSLVNNGVFETTNTEDDARVEIGELSGSGVLDVAGGKLLVGSQVDFTGTLTGHGELEITGDNGFTLLTKQDAITDTALATDVTASELTIAEAANGSILSDVKTDSIIIDKLDTELGSEHLTVNTLTSKTADTVIDIEIGDLAVDELIAKRRAEYDLIALGGAAPDMNLVNNDDVTTDDMQKLLANGLNIDLLPGEVNPGIMTLTADTMVQLGVRELEIGEATWTVGDSTTGAGLIVLNDSGELKNADILDYVRKVKVSGDATIDLTNVDTAADNPVKINGLSDSETGTGNLTVQGTTDDYVAINNTVIENAEDPEDSAYVADYTGKLILKDVNADLALEDVTVDATTADTTITGSIEGGSLTVYQDSTAQVGDGVLKLTDTTLNVVIPKDFIKLDQETLAALEGSIADLGGEVEADWVDVEIGTLDADGKLVESLGYNKYFDLDTLRIESNGVVLADRNTSYYSDALTSAETSENGAAGLTLADAALLNLNPQGDAVTGDLAAVLDQLDRMVAAGDAAGADELGANLAGASTAVLGMAAMGDVDRQLRAIRNRTTTMGVDQTVVNHDMPYFNAWINAEGDQREMKDDGTLGGYKLNSWGGTVGFDVDIDPTFTAGLALTAMYGDLDATGADKATGNMDTYYVSAFARYCDSAWTHTFVATAGMGDISLDRTVNGTTIEGETDSMSFGLMYEVGRVFALDEDATACIQPVFNVAWRHASVDGYTEKGSDAALEVGDQSLNTITFGLGARLQAVVGESMYNRTSIFECRLLAKADVGDRDSAADVALAGAEAEVKSAETGAFGLEAGAGLTIPLGDEGSSIFMDASVELRADYTNVNGTVGYRINF